MGLNLYRRHKRACKAGYPHNHCSGEFEERRKGWKRCDCPIFASGTLNEKFNRKSTDVWDWGEAKEIARQWESQDSGTVLPAQVPAPFPAPSIPSAPTTAPVVKISEAISKYLADHKGDSAGSTTRMYGYLLNDFAAYSEQLGYIWIHQWRPEDVREFRQSWKVKSSTSRKNMSNLKPFFEFCVENRWIPFNPARLKTRRTRHEADTSERIPFSDEELERMFLACAKKYGQGENALRYRWTGQDISDFIAVSVYTGLRISDVAMFRSSRLKANGECFIRATKNNKEVCTWIPIWLQERIRARAKQFGDLIFGKHETESLDSITDQWRRRLNNLWKLCGPWPDRPVHHRFRHTFARILLQQGNVTVRDVAELLGDTEETVRKYYGAWVSERQDRVTEVLRQAFAGKPTPIPMTSQRDSSQPN
ncbi:MAG: tyrosine-type recombinase/integrase [Terracidiphilus sp.]|jgi:integrase